MGDAQSRAARGEQEPTKLTFREWFEQWIASRRGEVRGSTFVNYQSAARRYVLPAIGGLRLGAVTKARLRALYQQLAENGGRGGRPLSQKTVHNVSAMLTKVFGDAIEDRLLPGPNPAERAHKLPTSRIDMRTWTGRQVAGFLDFVGSDRLFCLWRVAFFTGMRRGELLGLRWRDVDLDGAALSIQQTYIRGAEGLGYGAPKTAKGRRRITLDAETVGILRAQKRAQATLRIRAGSIWKDNDLVFAREDGSPIDPDVVSTQFYRLTARAGLPRIRLHDIRHTHATLLLMAGVHPKVVSERLGHSSILITLDTYSHVLPGLQEDAVDRFAAVVGAKARSI
jgi:integrase